MSETLDLLDEIVKGAEAASGKGAGEPLRAAEWNTLADSIARLARLAAAREKNEADTLNKIYARVDHEHLGEVGLTWFDPPTRALVEGLNRAADVVVRLNDLARETTALRADLTALSGQVDRLRDGLRDATDAQTVRDRTTEALGNRLDGVIEVDRRVTELDSRLTGMGNQVQQALDFRSSLVDVTGAPIDVSGLVGRVSTLESTADRLRLADGEVVRIRDFESRIANLEGRTIDSGVLDSRINNRLDALAADATNPFTSRIATTAAATLTPRITALETGAAATRNDITTLQGRSDANTASVTDLGSRLDAETSRTDALTRTVTGLGSLTTRVSTLESGLTAANNQITSLAALRGDVTTLQTTVNGLSGLASQVTTLRRDVDAQVGRLSAVETQAAGIDGLNRRLSTVETATAGIATLNTRLTAAEGRLTDLDGRITVNDSRIGTLANIPDRLSVLERDSADVATWRRGVDTRLSTLPDRTAVADLNARLSTVESTTASQQVQIARLSSTTTTRTGTTVITRPPA